ncbi:MAG: undecaprenyl-diphosphate phosphatase [bacterium]|nr:undecaprenyl-diphosphate phosphatase [bacterium]
MTPLQAALLGLIQGLTEFLPVSSSGHLALGQAILGIETGDITFEVIVHFGTLLAVLTALRERIRNLVGGCFQGDRKAWRMVLLLVLGTVPAAVAGLAFKDSLASAFADPRAVSGWLMVTGMILWSTRSRTGERTQMRFWDTIWIGVAQALAVLPGISRSGSTIAAGLWRGLDGREAATFSFLLSIPIILGATVLEVGDLVAHPPTRETLVPLVIGACTAYVSGGVAIRWLLRILQGGRLDRFAYYCWVVGAVGLLFFGA